HCGSIAVGVQGVTVARHRRAVRSGADDGAEIACAVVLIDGYRTAGDVDADGPSGGIVAIEREIALPVRDFAEAMQVVVLIGDGLAARHGDAAKLARRVVTVSQLVAVGIGISREAVEAVALDAGVIERGLYVARGQARNAIAGGVCGLDGRARGVGAG